MNKKDRTLIEPGGVLITQRTREAIHEAARERTDEELKECFKSLYDSMDQFGKRIAVEQITGQDFIIYTPERRIGKTQAALFLAHEYNVPYLVTYNMLSCVRQQAEEAGYKIKFIILNEVTTMDKIMNGARIRTILKDECITIKKAREKIGRDINIIGIEQF